jgi:hypothetical protein
MALLDLQSMELPKMPDEARAAAPSGSRASKGCAPSGLSLLLC